MVPVLAAAAAGITAAASATAAATESTATAAARRDRRRITAKLHVEGGSEQYRNITFPALAATGNHVR
jgi:hypothetical protein